MRKMKRVSSVLREDVLGAIDPADFATTMRVLGQIKDTLGELDRGERLPAVRKQAKP